MRFFMLSEGPQIEEFPPEVIVHILSYLGLTDFNNASMVNVLWNQLAKSKSFWKGLILDCFPYLQQRKPILCNTMPKKLFQDEMEKWRHISAFSQIALKYVFSALKGDTQLIAAAELSDEDRNILTILCVALHDKTATLQDNEQELAAHFKEIFSTGEQKPLSFCTSQLSQKQREFLFLIQNSFVNTTPNSSVIVNLFKENFIAEQDDNPTANKQTYSLFDKMNALSLEELSVLKEAINDMVFMMFGFDELDDTKQAVLNKLYLSEDEKKFILDFFNEYYNQDLCQTDPLSFTGQKFNHCQAMISHLSDNLITINLDIILQKCNSLIELKKEAVCSKVLTQHYDSCSVSDQNNHKDDNSDDEYPHSDKKPRYK